MNPLLALNERGQFVWLDHISRGLITFRGKTATFREHARDFGVKYATACARRYSAMDH